MRELSLRVMKRETTVRYNKRMKKKYSNLYFFNRRLNKFFFLDVYYSAHL